MIERIRTEGVLCDEILPSASYDSCDATSLHAEESHPVIAEAHSTAVRYSLGGLLTFGALNALGGGYYGLTGAVGVPTEWLEGSPFARLLRSKHHSSGGRGRLVHRGRHRGLIGPHPGFAVASTRTTRSIAGYGDLSAPVATTSS